MSISHIAKMTKQASAATKKTMPKTKEVPTPAPTPVDNAANPVIPLMRCVTQLKKRVNEDVEDKLTKLKDTHGDMVNALDELAKKDDKDACEKERATIVKKYGEQNVNAYEELKKSRTSRDAGVYLSVLLEKIAHSLLMHGLTVTINSATEGTTVKVGVDKYASSTTLKDLDVYPLLCHLDNFSKLITVSEKSHATKKKKKDDQAEEEANTNDDGDANNESGSDSEKTKVLSHKTTVHHLFKKLLKEHWSDKKVQCSDDVKSTISSLLIDFTNLLGDAVKVLTKDVSKSHTVTHTHLKSTLKLLFLSNNRSDEAFLKEMDALYKARLEQDKKGKGKEKEKDTKKK